MTGGATGGRACLFAIGPHVLAVEVAEAREILTVEALTRVPGAPAHVLGVVSRRGALLPVLDLRPLLAEPSRPLEPGAPSLVVETGDGPVGLAVDRVLGLEPFETVRPVDRGAAVPPAHLGRGWIDRPGRPAVLLDLPRVLSTLRGRRTGP